MAAVTVSLLLLSIVVWVIACYLLVWQFRKRRVKREGGLTVGIFHPYCNAGGGGEKVLWCAIRALQMRYPHIDVVVYTGDTGATPEHIVALAERRLNARLARPVHFVYLQTRWLVEAEMYPVCTLLMQSLGSVLLGAEALWRYLPDIYIETMGYAFTYPLFSWVGGCKVACYVHYPTITPEMLMRVSERVEAHNNRALVARSSFFTNLKLIYYKLFASLYRVAGRRADVIMVNSSWTKGHIVDLWGRGQDTHLVYPPCDTDPLTQLPHKDSDQIRIVSLGQFRPEKDHPLQVKALQILKTKVAEDVWPKVRLVLIGSCRGEQDEARVEAVRRLCQELGVSGNVEFKVNISFDELKEEFQLGTVGLHTMWNEHFGIGVVECMAAGLMMLAHRSGGPKMDIVDEREGSRTGYLAETADEYAETIATIIHLPEQRREEIRKAARASVRAFAVEQFAVKLLAALSPLFDSKKEK